MVKKFVAMIVEQVKNIRQMDEEMRKARTIIRDHEEKVKKLKDIEKKITKSVE